MPAIRLTSLAMRVTGGAHHPFCGCIQSDTMCAKRPQQSTPPAGKVRLVYEDASGKQIAILHVQNARIYVSTASIHNLPPSLPSLHLTSSRSLIFRISCATHPRSTPRSTRSLPNQRPAAPRDAWSAHFLPVPALFSICALFRRCTSKLANVSPGPSV